MAAELDNLVLIEILCRLNSTKLVFRCKCVSKYWNSLISDEYFIGRFIHYHQDNSISMADTNYVVFLNNYFWIHDVRDGVKFIASWDGQGINHQVGPILARGNDGQSQFDRVECSFNDLLLCSSSRSRIYYIMNAFTKEHVDLPMLHRKNWRADSRRNTCRVGFVCEPFYTQGRRGQFGLKANYRYKVVRFVGPKRIETYCSETRKWTVRNDKGDGSDRRFNSNIMAHDGKLYWYNNLTQKVVVYDPFVATEEPFFYYIGIDINGPPNPGGGFGLARSQGSLLLTHLTRDLLHNVFSMWKLKENWRHEAWCFQSKVVLNHCISDSSPSIIRQLVIDYNIPWAYGVHPNNQDVIFVGFLPESHIASYNLKTKEWQSLGKFRHSFQIYGEFGVRATLSWWPTPVH